MSAEPEKLPTKAECFAAIYGGLITIDTPGLHVDQGGHIHFRDLRMTYRVVRLVGTDAAVVQLVGCAVKPALDAQFTVR